MTEATEPNAVPPSAARALVLPASTPAMDEAAAELALAALQTAGEAVPLHKTEELLAALNGPAIRAVLAERFAQIVHRGHDAEHDDGLPLCWLAKLAHEYAAIAIDRLGGIQGQRNLAKGRLRLAACAAICMAAIDQLDRAMAAGKES